MAANPLYWRLWKKVLVARQRGERWFEEKKARKEKERWRLEHEIEKWLGGSSLKTDGDKRGKKRGGF